MTYAQAQAANDDLRSLSDTTADIMVNLTHYRFTADDARAMLATPSDGSENAFGTRLRAYAQLHDVKAGLEEAQHYVTAFPKSADALGLRAIFEAANNMPEQAKADAAAGAALGPDLNNAKIVTAYYHALPSLTEEGIDPIPFFAWALWGQAEVCRRDRDLTCARHSAEEALSIKPDISMLYVILANVDRAEGNLVKASGVADRMMTVGAKNPDMLAVAGVIYCSTGQCPKGLAAFAASLAVKPNLTAYLNRIRYLPKTDTAARKRDIDGALRLKPHDPEALQALADWQGDTGDHAGQSATLQTIAAAAANDTTPDYEHMAGLGVAYLRAGQLEKAREIFAEVRGYAMAMKNAQLLNNMCYMTARANFDLETALSDCNRAIAIEPKSPAILDSLGFVQLRLGHLPDAIAAFNQALAIAPLMAPSLYGRGIALIRQGDHTKGQADVTAATRLDAGIVDRFKEIGVGP